jgi:hypothetical protein
LEGGGRRGGGVGVRHNSRCEKDTGGGSVGDGDKGMPVGSGHRLDTASTASPKTRYS